MGITLEHVEKYLYHIDFVVMSFYEITFERNLFLEKWAYHWEADDEKIMCDIHIFLRVTKWDP